MHATVITINAKEMKIVVINVDRMKSKVKKRGKIRIF